MIRTTCYLRRDLGWTQPHSAEVRELIASRGLTQLEAARLVGHGGSDRNAARQIRRYESGERDIPYHVWRLLILEPER